jgi:hypothetical protein
MNSGGKAKTPYETIYIEAPFEVADQIFQEKFGRDPDNVTCECCGPDFSFYSVESNTNENGLDGKSVLQIDADEANALLKQRMLR